jgi:hypothetical protein
MERVLIKNEIKDYFINNFHNFYFHDPNSLNWSTESYENICKIKDLDELYVINFLIEKKIMKGMFFLMKNDIFPQWDNDDNKNGGTVSMKILENETSYYWNEISLKYVLGELIENQEDLINGISISPKKNFSIIKFWVNDKKKIKIQTLKNDFNIPKIYKGDLVFKSYFI